MAARTKKLSPRKQKFIEYLKLKNYISLNPSELAKEIGICRSTCYRWLRNEELLERVEEERVVEINDIFPEVLNILISLVRKGNVQAIKLFFDRYDVKNSPKTRGLEADRRILDARHRYEQQNRSR